MNKKLDAIEKILQQHGKINKWMFPQDGRADTFFYSQAPDWMRELLAIARAAEKQIGHAIADDDIYTPEFNALIRAVKALDSEE